MAIAGVRPALWHLALQKDCATPADGAHLPFLRLGDLSLTPDFRQARVAQLPNVYVVLQAAGIEQMSCAEHHVARGGFARGDHHLLLPFCFCSLSKPFKAPCFAFRILHAGLNGEISRGAVFLYARVGEVVCIRAECLFFISPCSLITEDYSNEAAGDISCRCGVRPSPRLLPFLEFV